MRRGDADDGRLEALEGDVVAPPEAADDGGSRCIRSGNCCKHVYLWQGTVDLFKERDTKRWVEYHGIETFTADREGNTYWGVKLDIPCQWLVKDEVDRYFCAIYDTRPFLCRIYRGLNPDGPQAGCGFNVGRPPEGFEQSVPDDEEARRVAEAWEQAEAEKAAAEAGEDDRLRQALADRWDAIGPKGGE